MSRRRATRLVRKEVVSKGKKHVQGYHQAVEPVPPTAQAAVSRVPFAPAAGELETRQAPGEPESRCRCGALTLPAGETEQAPIRTAETPSGQRGFLLVISGKMGSGKDSVAEAAAHEAAGGREPVRVFFADPLKQELEQVHALVRAGTPADRIAVETGCTREQAARVVDILARIPDQVTVRDRTPETRLAAQYWGAEVRRAGNPNYWVDAASQQVEELLAAGESVYVTDARYPNEVEAMVALGGFAVRLEVPERVRAARIAMRDGQAPDVEAMRHPSELALDEYRGYQLVVDNTAPFDQVVSQVVGEFRTHLACRCGGSPLAG